MLWCQQRAHTARQSSARARAGHCGRVPLWVGLGCARQRCIGPSCVALCSKARPLCWPSRAGQLRYVARPCTRGFDPLANNQFKSFSIFHIHFHSSLNLENSYLIVYCSKIHLIIYVGFLNSGSIHEKYQTEQ
jgi:hypothetical protein